MMHEASLKTTATLNNVRHLNQLPRKFFQPKLTINQPNDVYEQEADAMADKVMRMTNNESTQQPFFKPAISYVQRKCDSCEEEEETVQRKESTTKITDKLSTESYLNSISGGQTLPENELHFFESKMGYDFSKVKVHTDNEANESAKNLNANAYTYQNNIVFSEGLYQPGSETGKRLLAHELTHVVQQHSASPTAAIQRQLYPPVPIIFRPLCRRLRNSGTATPNTGIEVSWTGRQIAIRARLQITGSGATEQVANGIKRDIERVWNANFSDGFSSTCQVFMLLGGPEDDTLAQVIVGTGGNVSDSYTVGSTMYFMYSGSTRDLVWSPSHEFAHFLGLDDRRSSPWYMFGMGPETSHPGYEHNIMGAMPGGDYNRRTELALESHNIRDWLNRFATETVPCDEANTA